MKKAKWKSREEHNDYIHAECSGCGFQVESYDAVETGRSSTEYIKAKWKFCPKCGCFKICADQFEQLGTYKTEERAMEVLDMIATQSALCNAGVAVYLVDEIEKAWYMDMPEE